MDAARRVQTSPPPFFLRPLKKERRVTAVHTPRRAAAPLSPLDPLEVGLLTLSFVCLVSLLGIASSSKALARPTPTLSHAASARGEHLRRWSRRALLTAADGRGGGDATDDAAVARAAMAAGGGGDDGGGGGAGWLPVALFGVAFGVATTYGVATSSRRTAPRARRIRRLQAGGVTR